MNDRQKLLIGAAIVIILLLLIGAYALSGSNNNTTATPIPTATPTPTPTPTPVPSGGTGNGASTPTATPVPTATATPVPTIKPIPVPVATSYTGWPYYDFHWSVTPTFTPTPTPLPESNIVGFNDVKASFDSYDSSIGYVYNFWDNNEREVTVDEVIPWPNNRVSLEIQINRSGDLSSSYIVPVTYVEPSDNPVFEVRPAEFDTGDSTAIMTVVLDLTGSGGRITFSIADSPEYSIIEPTDSESYTRIGTDFFIDLPAF